jgi:hypothetical protein
MDSMFYFIHEMLKKNKEHKYYSIRVVTNTTDTVHRYVRLHSKNETHVQFVRDNGTHILYKKSEIILIDELEELTKIV